MTIRTLPTSGGDVVLRPIRPEDDATVAAIIRIVMPEFGACGAGFAINDAEVDTMASAYDRPGAAYFVIERNGMVVGGGGVAPLDGGASDTCELRKMYFLREARGVGAGRMMLEHCLAEAERLGYRYCYLETLERMTTAQALYRAFGFVELDGPRGATGHHGCDRFFGLALAERPRG